MTICIDNSDSKNVNDKSHRNGYTALCRDHQDCYGKHDYDERLEAKEDFYKRIQKRDQWIEKNPGLWEIAKEYQDLVCF